MTYKIVRLTKQNSHAWDEYVGEHKQGTPYHRAAWVESVEQAYQHQNVSLMAFQQDQVVGVLPCVQMKRPFASTKLCSLPFCDLGHALADDEKIIAALQKQATESIEHTSFEYRGSLQTEPSDNPDIPQSSKVRMVLPLPSSSDELMASFKSKLRSQIRKAEKNGLTYTVSNNHQQIDDFYQIFAINMRKLGSPVHSKKWFTCLFENYAEHIILSVVYSDSTPVGAGIVLRSGQKVCIPWASTVAEYNRLAPNMMLYWSLLKHACDIGCDEFDFGRSSFGEGTFKFKKQWGAQAIPLKWDDLANPTMAEADLAGSQPSKIRPIVENLWTKLPLGMTTRLGPIIRRHISL
jgi:FemAB-related protein (PEP-CTERM system-associated)